MPSNKVKLKTILSLQINANGLKNHANELQIWINKRVDVVLITEIYFTTYLNIYIPVYTLFKKISWQYVYGYYFNEIFNPFPTTSQFLTR